MKSFFLSRIQSFRHAFRGWFYVLRTQPNAWVQSVVAIVIFILGIWLRISPLEWAVIILTTAVVFAAEFLNTAIETVVDLASPDIHPLAKVGKDVGAAAVMVSALAAILIGLLLFGPPLWLKLTTLIAVN